MRTDLRSKIYDLRLLLAVLAALAVILVAWLVPLPHLMLGEEAQAAARLPQDRTDVSQAEAAFEQAQNSYKAYVATNDVGAAFNTLESALSAVQADPANRQLGAAFNSATGPVIQYADQLQAYALAGEAYFNQVKHYDDELMSWTRSLGADSESLRPDTWPIVEYLKLYPPPIGEKAEYSNVASASISGAATMLGSTSPGPYDQDTLSQYQSDINQLREAGRSIEYIESLHAQYRTFLNNYDTKLQVVASGASGGSLSGSRTVLALATNLLLGLALVVGLVALFLPRLRAGKEAAS
ncbi:MAG TPA: hypothetical protein VLQ48_15910 [Chloroflexia bacterium]|nr:hypothetical protein [Chloroflexia bacterium]